MYVIYGNELYHYGIPGMRWGHRKAQPASGSNSKPKRGSEEYYRDKAGRAIAKISTSKTRLGKDINNYRAFGYEANANRAANKITSKSEKGLIKKLDTRYGHGANAAGQNASANYYSRKAEYSKTRLGKSINNSKAFNERSWAKTNEKLHASKNLKDYGSNFVKSFSNTPVKTWSGRTTTNGKQVVDQLLTVGIMGTVKDIGYYKNSK